MPWKRVNFIGVATVAFPHCKLLLLFLTFFVIKIKAKPWREKELKRTQSSWALDNKAFKGGNWAGTKASGKSTSQQFTKKMSTID